MIRKWLLLLSLSSALGLSALNLSYAQNSRTFGSNSGAVVPGKSSASKVAPDAAVGSAGSVPETSLSRSSVGEPATREGDVKNQIVTLAPYALILAVLLAAGLYFFVFRKPTTPEGEAASEGKINERN